MKGTTRYPALTFALHSTVAALLALALAVQLQLHHPWWAAMTVWLVAQPTRGLLIERCLMRLAGTALGALAAGLLLYGLFDTPLGMLLLLALWLVLCAALGNLFRHLRSYAWVLAGYTAAIVVLFGMADPVPDPRLAGERVISTVLGILCSATVSWLFTPRSTPLHLLEERLQRLTTDTLLWCTTCPTKDLKGFEHLLGALHEIDIGLDQGMTGSPTGIGLMRQVDRVLDALLVLMAIVLRHGAMSERWRAQQNCCATQIIIDWVAALQALPASHERQQLLGALKRLHTLLSGQPVPTAFWQRLRHHDWRAAASSALRPLMSLAFTALIWQLTQWSHGPIMSMTAVLFASLFSSHGNTRMAIRDVSVGSLCGALCALFASLLVLPHADSLPALLLCLIPFLLPGAMLMARPGTAKLAIDLNMTFLLIAQPGVSQHAGAENLLGQTLAIALGICAAAASLLIWQPAHPASRRLALARRIARQTARACVPGQQANAHAKSLRLLRSLLLIDHHACALVRAAFACLAATADSDASNTPYACQAACLAADALATCDSPSHLARKRL